MKENKLYIVEGLPCSGKSTTCKYVADILRFSGRKVVHIDEGTGKHPADYEFQSFISKKALAEFSKEEQEIILECSKSNNDGYIVELSLLYGELFDKALNYKIYDFLDWEIENEIMLEKWREFANGCGDNVYVFNCCLLQNPMCETMMRFGFDIQVSKKYILEICNIIKELNPIVIYLANSDVKTSISNTCHERGSEWLNSVIDYHVNGVYGKEHKLAGFDGYISCLEERQRRELEIIKELPVKSLVIENAHEDWKNAYNTIHEFIIT